MALDGDITNGSRIASHVEISVDFSLSMMTDSRLSLVLNMLLDTEPRRDHEFHVLAVARENMACWLPHSLQCYQNTAELR